MKRFAKEYPHFPFLQVPLAELTEENKDNVKLVADYSADYVKYGIKLSYENNINHQKGCTYTTISKTFR